ncbi:phosphate signaling complex PhoU family protein [Nocardia otitidiscaviarum]|uniref:phosphate signaling complex PhoU family protein n=1 Tax=Nocardia otitidiscaviarum TaxID=1823 RepID=UPI0018931B5F|nr:PhoU domain-containing protein [Nocardia otitidiscaviarum]MBF6180468.1 phosphate uptake regulator, PhoU [Nocardia otitidiscaviarum]
MRTKFSYELTTLTHELAHMARLAHEATERATAALTDTDLGAAYEVFALEEQLQAKHATCEDRSVILLALEAPVARDLRHVVTAIQIADDLNGIGGALSRVADSVVRRHPLPVAPPHVVTLLTGMATATTHLAAAAVAAIVARPPSPDLAPIPADATLDRLHRQVLRVVGDTSWAHGAAMAVDVALLAQHYDRCAAHCVRIGRLIRFLHTGIPLSAQVEP